MFAPSLWEHKPCCFQSGLPSSLHQEPDAVSAMMLMGGRECRCDGQVGMLRVEPHWVGLQIPSAPLLRKEQVGNTKVEVMELGQVSDKTTEKRRQASSYFYLQGPTLNTLLSPTKCHLSAGRKLTPLADKG